MWQSEIYSISSLLALVTPKILSFAFVQLIAHLQIYIYIFVLIRIPVFSVVLCSLSFHWIEHLVMELAAASASFFKRRNQKNKRKKKKKKRKQLRLDAFNRLKEWFKQFYVVAGTHGTTRLVFSRDFWFQSSKTHPRLLIQISSSSLQKLISHCLSRQLVPVFKY